MTVAARSDRGRSPAGAAADMPRRVKARRPMQTRCRICRTSLPEPFLDFGTMPLANSFLPSRDACTREPSYPLAVTACPECGLVQLTYVVAAEQMYRQYLYVSSTSEAVRRYAAGLADRVIARHRLGPARLVVELGSNDGLVLREFQRGGVRVLGVEPAENVAAIARGFGVPTLSQFFSAATAKDVAAAQGPADVILGRHVFAHIDDVHDFFEGVSGLLTSQGVLLIEVPYLGHLVARLEFDTIYHEHLSYVSVEPMRALCEQHGFRIADVEPVALHGGSILFSIQRAEVPRRETSRVASLRRSERQRRLAHRSTLEQFARRVVRWKQVFEARTDRLGRVGARLIGYGAAAKANTLLNFCPRTASRLRYILDRNPHKQGLYTPGTHLPVVDAAGWSDPEVSHMLILAWNFQEEIMAQMHSFAKRGGRFVIPIPRPEVV